MSDAKKVVQQTLEELNKNTYTEAVETPVTAEEAIEEVVATTEVSATDVETKEVIDIKEEVAAPLPVVHTTEEARRALMAEKIENVEQFEAIVTKKEEEGEAARTELANDIITQDLSRFLGEAHFLKTKAQDLNKKAKRHKDGRYFAVIAISIEEAHLNDNQKIETKELYELIHKYADARSGEGSAAVMTLSNKDAIYKPRQQPGLGSRISPMNAQKFNDSDYEKSYSIISNLTQEIFLIKQKQLRAMRDAVRLALLRPKVDFHAYWQKWQPKKVTEQHHANTPK